MHDKTLRAIPTGDDLLAAMQPQQLPDRADQSVRDGSGETIGANALHSYGCKQHLPSLACGRFERTMNWVCLENFTAHDWSNESKNDVAQQITIRIRRNRSAAHLANEHCQRNCTLVRKLLVSGDRSQRAELDGGSSGADGNFTIHIGQFRT
jgi:hypothetical protein